ncbi:hypothetical protein RRF57_011736 [Xylaria bambusicola]|uniref:Uncharacterized protein n=1 Tax=Xylaria bambusicola TaxID=326684 RepID=A0AAN7UNC6_9PEZI
MTARKHTSTVRAQGQNAKTQARQIMATAIRDALACPGASTITIGPSNELRRGGSATRELRSGLISGHRRRHSGSEAEEGGDDNSGFGKHSDE